MTTSSTDASKAPNKSARYRKILIAFLAAISLLALVNLFLRINGIPPETAMRIECAREMSLGKVPNVDVFTLDSPLMSYLMLIPVAVASIFQCTWGYAVVGFTLVYQWLLATLSLAFCSWLLLSRPRLRDALWCHGLLMMMAALNVIWVYQFGQAEHLLVLGLTPYLIGRWLEYRRVKLAGWEVITCGVAGGIVSLLDPYYIALPMVIEVSLAMTFKRVVVTVVCTLTILLATVLVIASSLLLLLPKSMENYFSYVLPLLMVDRQLFDPTLYGSGSCPDGRLVIYAIIIATVFYFGMEKRNSLMPALLITGWLGYSYYIVMCKGFLYQTIPMLWSAALIFAIVSSILLKDICKWKHFRRITRGTKPGAMLTAIIALCIALSLLVQQAQQSAAETAYGRMKQYSHNDKTIAEWIDKETEKHETVLIVNDSPAPGFPLLTLKERKFGSSIVSAYIARTMEKITNIPEHAPLARKVEGFYYDILHKELESNDRPKLVFVEQGTMQDSLRNHGVLQLLEKYYIVVDEAKYYCDNTVPCEYNGYNCPFAIYSKVLFDK